MCMRVYKLIVVFLLFGISGNGQNSQFYYDNIYTFRGGYALVCTGHKWGIINKKFEEVIPLILDHILTFDGSDYFFDGYVHGVINDTTILFDTLGVPKFSVPGNDYYPFPNKSWKNEIKIDSFVISCFGNIWGCTTLSGRLIVPSEYNYVYKGLSNHFIAIREDPYPWIFDENTQCNDFYSTHVYNAAGQIIYEQKRILFYWEKVGIYFIIQDNKYYAADSTFKIINSQPFDCVKFADDLCWVQIDKKWGLIDRQFNNIIEPVYDGIYETDKWFAIEQNRKFAFADKKGNIITDLKYDGYWTDYFSCDDTVITTKIEDHILFLNLKGECIHNCEPSACVEKFYPNGRLFVEGNYDGYRKAGIWTYYNDDPPSSIDYQIQYLDSIKIYKEYHPDGTLNYESIEERAFR